MKKMKLVAAFAALVSVFGLSSCLDSGESGTTYDGFDFVTVKETMGLSYLACESGLILNPLSTTVLSQLQQKDGSYYPRAYVGFKLAEGETATEGKTSYKISEIGVYSALPCNDFNSRQDTLKADDAIVEFQGTVPNVGSFNRVWAKNGYVNVPFTFKYGKTLSSSDFHLYVTDAKEDTLYTRFRQSVGEENTYQTGNAVISFAMPFNKDVNFQEKYMRLQPKNDSIVIKVSAKGENGTTLVQSAKYKWSER